MEELRQAIVLQAVRDLRRGDKSAEEWFRSGEHLWLCDIDGEEIIKKCKRPTRTQMNVNSLIMRIGRV